MPIRCLSDACLILLRTLQVSLFETSLFLKEQK
jgi:hypothetical protein